MAEIARFQYAFELLNVNINSLRIYLTVKSKPDAVIKKLGVLVYAAGERKKVSVEGEIMHAFDSHFNIHTQVFFSSVCTHSQDVTLCAWWIC
jgi:hypothetical protein